MTKFGQFSVGWSVSITFLHAGVTLALAALMFVGRMGSFTTGPGAGFYLTKTIMWIWSPFAMMAGDEELGFTIPPEGVAAIWSLIVGVAAGFVAPFFKNRQESEPISLRGNRDLIGTPWEQKPAHNFKTLREAEDETKTKKPNKSEQPTPRKPSD